MIALTICNIAQYVVLSHADIGVDFMYIFVSGDENFVYDCLLI
jgi:hypothetical protein